MMIYHHTKFGYKNISSSVDASKSPVLIRQTLILTIANQPSCMTLAHNNAPPYKRLSGSEDTVQTKPKYTDKHCKAAQASVVCDATETSIYYYHHYYKCFPFTPAPLTITPEKLTWHHCHLLWLWGGGHLWVGWWQPWLSLGLAGQQGGLARSHTRLGLANRGWAGTHQVDQVRWAMLQTMDTHTHVWQHAKILANHPAIDKTVLSSTDKCNRGWKAHVLFLYLFSH